MGKKKPYKYNSKSRLTADSQSFPFKVIGSRNLLLWPLRKLLYLSYFVILKRERENQAL